MKELHEVNLKTYEDIVIKKDIDYIIESYISEYRILKPKYYYYTVEIFNIRNKSTYSNYSTCEICGKSFNELLNIDPNNDKSWTALNVGKHICKNCAKPIYAELRAESCKEHREGCTCHSCIIAIEAGYKKKNNEWIKL